MKYAIIRKEDREFYPDPIYTNIEKAKAKIDYLINYRLEHKMDEVKYGIEKLTEEREIQHNKEWTQWLSMID